MLECQKPKEIYCMLPWRERILVPGKSRICCFDAENPCAWIRGVDREFAGQSNRDCEFDVLIRVQPDKLKDVILLHDGSEWLGVGGVSLYTSRTGSRNPSRNPLKSSN